MQPINPMVALRTLTTYITESDHVVGTVSGEMALESLRILDACCRTTTGKTTINPAVYLDEIKTYIEEQGTGTCTVSDVNVFSGLDLIAKYLGIEDFRSKPEIFSHREEAINHPRHYNDHPSGVECITIVEWFNFNLGNAIKYIWRAGIKSNDTIEDLRKAVWYVNREIERLTKVKT